VAQLNGHKAAHGTATVRAMVNRQHDTRPVSVQADGGCGAAALVDAKNVKLVDGGRRITTAGDATTAVGGGVSVSIGEEVGTGWVAIGAAPAQPATTETTHCETSQGIHRSEPFLVVHAGRGPRRLQRSPDGCHIT